MEDIEQVLTPHKKWAWRPVTEEGDSPSSHSKFAGIPLLTASETWPCCGHCSQPMQLFLQLSSKELPEEANTPFGDGILQVFYCINEDKDCAGVCEAFFPFSDSTLIRVLNFDNTLSDKHTIHPSAEANELPQISIIGWEKIDDYPCAEEYDDLNIVMNDEQYERILDSDFEVRNGDKLLGWPLWGQSIEYPSCPECNEAMDYIFQIDSGNNLDFLFGDCGTAHITQCKTHRNQMTIAWAC